MQPPLLIMVFDDLSRDECNKSIIKSFLKSLGKTFSKVCPKNYMARYTGPKEKIERRIGEKIGIKGMRSQMGKTAITKKPYPPGLNGQKPSRKLSEFGQQLKTKQKVRNIYRLLEKQFKGYIKSSVASRKEPYTTI